MNDPLSQLKHMAKVRPEQRDGFGDREAAAWAVEQLVLAQDVAQMWAKWKLGSEKRECGPKDHALMEEALNRLTFAFVGVQS